MVKIQSKNKLVVSRQRLRRDRWRAALLLLLLLLPKEGRKAAKQGRVLHRRGSTVPMPEAERQN